MRISQMNQLELIFFADTILDRLYDVSSGEDLYETPPDEITDCILKISYILPKIGLHNDCFRHMRPDNIRNYHLMLAGLEVQIEGKFASFYYGSADLDKIYTEDARNVDVPWDIEID